MAYKHFFKRIIQFCYTFSNESSTERKNSPASHRNPKKTTTFAFNKRSVTSMRKCPIVQHVESDSGHSTKRLKRGGTTRICKTVKYNDLHLSPHSVYLSKQRLYRLKWIVTDNQWCKYAVPKGIEWFNGGNIHRKITYSIFGAASSLSNSGLQISVYLPFLTFGILWYFA